MLRGYRIDLTDEIYDKCYFMPGTTVRTAILIHKELYTSFDYSPLAEKQSMSLHEQRIFTGNSVPSSIVIFFSGVALTVTGPIDCRVSMFHLFRLSNIRPTSSISALARSMEGCSRYKEGLVMSVAVDGSYWGSTPGFR